MNFIVGLNGDGWPTAIPLDIRRALGERGLALRGTTVWKWEDA